MKSEYVFFDITDSAGTIKEDEDYYPRGGELQFVNSDSNHYKFTGKERTRRRGSIISARAITETGSEGL